MANNRSSYISLFALALFLILTSIASAENVTFIKEYTYRASDIDSKISSRAIALEQTKRALLEQLGTYLISETEVKNYQMTKDQVTMLTAGIVSAEIIDEKWDGRSYYLKAKISADLKEVAKSVDALRKDVQKSKELADSKKKAEEAMSEVERLKKELELVKTDTKKQGAYADAINDLTASDWFDKGVAFQESNNIKAAIDAYNNAIELNPQKAATYYNRGIAYAAVGNMQQAIKDNDKAIELNPQLAAAYANRGVAYSALGNKQEAIKDYDTAIELNPQDAKAYFNRGTAYFALGNMQQAIKDYDKAIELNPQLAAAYANRGVAYGMLGDNKMSIQNLMIAAKLGDTKAQNYLSSEGIDW